PDVRVAAQQFVVRSHYDAARGRFRCDHVERLASSYADALALTHGEAMYARVLTHDTAISGHQLTREFIRLDALLAKIGVDEGSIIAIRHEADFLAIGLRGRRNAVLARKLPYGGLLHAAERKHGARQFLLL